MKKYLMVILTLALLCCCAMAMAEAVDAVPPVGTPPLLEQAKFFDAAILGTYLGAMAGAEVLFLIVRWLTGIKGNAARVAVVVCAIVTVMAGRWMASQPMGLVDLVLAVFNGGLVAAALMKIYEATFGKASTPAGSI